MTVPERETVSMEIRVRGTVQGVGFRPTVWRLAKKFNLTGSVYNDAQGVLIQATGSQNDLSDFLSELKTDAPPLSRIDQIETTMMAAPTAPGFHIVQSSAGQTRTQVTPDAATCDACRSEILNFTARRHDYAFTNCTHCGPRFSIVQSVPYDRAGTTMAQFDMCDECQSEYQNPEDRRFHAQPIACPECGPRIWLEYFTGQEKPPEEIGSSEVIAQTAALLKSGAIIAIRGLGGFHLACDATNRAAVDRLRARKRRYAKPFALMARDVAVIQKYCAVSDAEKAVLQSAEAPIVILESNGPDKLPRSVAPAVGSLGFMLPYTPLHLLLMAHFDTPLVMTSGNLSDEPQVTRNEDARTKLSAIAGYGLMHDRDIANRIDDSVLRFMAGKPSLLRRARGYAPGAIALPEGFGAAPEITAFGGELKATFCMVKDGAAILSQHQGDLEDPATLDDYEKNMALYSDLYDHDPAILACDLHPEYLSSKLAQATGGDIGTTVIPVQHHHAHIASCMAENGIPLKDASVLGVALDGLGMGDNGALWGGEFLLADYRDYIRLATFKPVAMPGGAQAVREPWRNTYAHLKSAIGWEGFSRDYNQLDLYNYLQTKELAVLDSMQAEGINSPLASSCGRLFDAVAAALGVCRDRAFYEGQGAIELEAIAETDEQGEYPFNLTDTAPAMIDAAAMWRALLDDLHGQVPTATIAARFHNGLAAAITETVLALVAGRTTKKSPIDTIALTGGCFQNKRLLETVITGLASHDLKILTHSAVPANDGGLSLGQAAIAAARYINDTAWQGSA